MSLANGQVVDHSKHRESDPSSLSTNATIVLSNTTAAYTLSLLRSVLIF
jgi:hypothetical protein